MKYLERVGAIYDGSGYYYVNQGYNRLGVYVREDGTVEVDPRLPTPTPEECGEIKDNRDSLRKSVIPVYPIPPGARLPDLHGTIYEYRDEKNRLNMIVQRVEKDNVFDEDGKREKNCYPWIYDGVSWQQQSWPKDMKSPLFGNWHRRTRVMIHEGEKACLAAIEASRSDSTHPWRDWLARFGHCTWQGGSGRVHLADWKSIDRDAEVWILPDNDEPGYKAAQSLTDFLTHVKTVYLFHYRGFMVPRSWDIADPVFEENYDLISGRFSLAEKAVETRMTDDGKKYHVLRKEFAQKFAYATGSGEFVEVRRPRHLMGVTDFNHAYCHLAPEVRSLADMMLKSKDLPRRDRVGYRPQFEIDQYDVYHGPKRYYAGEDGADYVNMYLPPLIQERKPESAAELRPFLLYMRHLIPKPRERKDLLRWAACMLSGHRCRWAPLLISQKQGTGKSTFARILRTLVGPHNSSQVTSAALQDKFTSWAMNKQLVIVPELNEGSSFKLAEHLKTFIDGDEIPIRRMNVDQYDAESHISFCFSSNHMSAISVAKNDRRWFIPETTESGPPHSKMENEKLRRMCERYLDVADNPRGNAFFSALWRWFDGGGAEELLYVARRFGLECVKNGWRGSNDQAPMTERKEAVQERSKSAWQEFLDEVAEDAQILLEGDIRTYFQEENAKYVPKTGDVVDALMERGFFPQYTQPEAELSQQRRGVIKAYTLNGKQIRSIVLSREPLENPWRDERSKATLLSSKFKLAAGEDAL